MGNNNKFEIALKKNEVDKFLLGEGDYFFAGGELTGGEKRHDSSVTWVHIFQYLQNNCKEVNSIYSLLDETMMRIVEQKDDLTVVEFLHLCMYVWDYFIDSKEDEKIPETWNISSNLRTVIKDKIAYFEKTLSTNNEELKLIQDNNELLQERFGFEW